MPNISKLPLYVLKNILLYSVDNCFEVLDDWIELIPLVGVCKKWTSILSPVIFSTAYIGYDSDNNHRRCMTNVDCISIRGCYNNIKTMNIRIVFSDYDMSVLKQLQNLFQRDNINWTGISRLIIDFRFSDPIRSKNVSGKPDTHIVDFTQMHISKMPNIISLCILQYYEDSDFRQLLTLLINAYSAELQLLEMMPIIDSPTTHLGSHLKYLTLGFDDDILLNYKMSICAEPLCELYLTNAPVDIPWHIFYGYSEPGQISFKNLQKLSILYNIDNVSNQSNTNVTHPSGSSVVRNSNNSTDHTNSTTNAHYTYKIIFPQLRELTIQNSPNIVSYFNAIFGSTLSIIKLIGTLPCILKWAITLHSTRKLVMTFDADRNITVSEHTSMLNKLINETAHHHYRALNLKNIPAKLNLSLISWGNINELTIANVDVTDILTMLSKTPCLKKLTVYYIDINYYKTVDQVEKLFQQQVDTQLFAVALKHL